MLRLAGASLAERRFFDGCVNHSERQAALYALGSDLVRDVPHALGWAKDALHSSDRSDLRSVQKPVLVVEGRVTREPDHGP